MAHTILSFGHGYSAQALSRTLLPQGWQITGTTRSEVKAEALADQGVAPLIFPGDGDGDVADAIAQASHLLISAGPDASGDPVLNAVGDMISARARQFEWVGYLSTTGVYGDHQGAWVDENTPLTPSTRRGQWRKDAEEAWHAVPRLAAAYFSTGRHLWSRTWPLCQGARWNGAAHCQNGAGILSDSCRRYRAGVGRVDRATSARHSL